ncbi:hypothetical protein D3C80_348680 [compost metagenome]
MMIAVLVHTMKVSTNTPSICTKPWFTGCFTSDAAAAFGAEPIPASLENKPRLIPCIIAIDTAAPKKPPAAELKLKASVTISFKISGKIA